MQPRRPHAKSRNGCYQCKNRRVKCDEQRPVCSNCIKRGASCGFTNTNGGAQDSAVEHRDAASYSPVPSLSTDNSANRIGSRSVDGDEDLIKDHSPPNLNIPDLELLHNFTISTYKSLSTRADIQELWQIDMVKESFSSSFALQAILAFSAFHLADSRPSSAEKYLVAASAHQNVAIRNAREVLSDDTPENRKAICLFSSILVALSIASHPQSQQIWLNKPLTASVDWIDLVRTSRSMIRTGWVDVSHGPYKLLVQSLGKDPGKIHFTEEDQELDKLERIWAGHDSDRAINACSLALSDLRGYFHRFFSAVEVGACRVCVVFSWPAMLPQSYVDLLREGFPEALILLAFYCVLLHKLNKL